MQILSTEEMYPYRGYVEKTSYFNKHKNVILKYRSVTGTEII